MSARIVLLAALIGGLPLRAAPIAFDFTEAGAVAAWQAQNDVSALRATPDGMAIDISGSDPYLSGPARDYPAGSPLWLHVRISAPADGMAQVFWYTQGSAPNETDSIRFPVPGGKMAEVRVPIPPLGKATRLRLDPPGDHGTVTVALIEAIERPSWKEPAWPKLPVSFRTVGKRMGAGAMYVDEEPGGVPGAFTVMVGDKPMAVGNARPLIGYVVDGTARWVDINQDGKGSAGFASGAQNVVSSKATDPDGGEWMMIQDINQTGNCADVTVTVFCTRDRDILYLPMLTILAGAGTFGEDKNQALFAGLEYLDKDEPSSSEKDIIGPGAHRRVPDTAKITQPLMVVQQGGRYVGLTWEPSPDFCAVFDSPDRTFKSGGHLMGVLFPGSDGSNREEGSLLPYGPAHVEAGRKITLHARIIGGTGDSVVPAIQQYVKLNPPPQPPLSSVKLDLPEAGWLDSGIRKDGQYAHAYPGSFQPQPAADAAMWMDYLAGLEPNAQQANRLHEAAVEALSHVSDGYLNTAGVGHVRYPAPALVYSHALESVRTALREGRELLKRFEPDGSVIYHPKPGDNDLGRTHYAKDANGLTADAVARVLEAAAYTGDASLKREGLRVLDALGKFANSAPRGAQTWEVPLHTPDILASANLVKAYVLGYELTKDQRYLENARYWAWTGVPFVYLVKPVDKPVGLYGTIAVYGATQWTAPNWMGLPVQWCGLVYAAALIDLSRYDSTGPWSQLAKGIAASGAQQTHPVGVDPRRQGLLPDSFNLHGQIRNDVAINPATLLSTVPFINGLTPVYNRLCFGNGTIAHAPGRISASREDASGAWGFQVHGWPKGPYKVLIVGLQSRPTVTVNGKTTEGQFDALLGALALAVSGDAKIVLWTR